MAAVSNLTINLYLIDAWLMPDWSLVLFHKDSNYTRYIPLICLTPYTFLDLELGPYPTIETFSTLANTHWRDACTQIDKKMILFDNCIPGIYTQGIWI